MKRIVITGATSMIGLSLAKLALARGMEAVCIVRKDSARICDLPKSERLTVISASMDEYAGLDVSALGVTDAYSDKDAGGVFYHLAWDKTRGAARDDVFGQAENIRYTLDAVRLASRLGCEKFVGAGSQAEYGLVSGQLKPDTPADPDSAYGIAKYAAGKFGGRLCSQMGMRFNWVRILSVYGAADGANTLIMYAIRELIAMRSPELTKCEQIWDYLYCDDAASALLAVGEKGRDGKTYVVGSGEKRKLSEYIETVRDIVAPDIELLFGKKEYAHNQPMYLCADISELTNDTGWRPEVTFEEGIRRMDETV